MRALRQRQGDLARAGAIVRSSQTKRKGLTAMRSFTPIVIAALVAAIAVPAASAGGSKPKPKDVCVQYNVVTHATKCFAKGTPVTPVAHPITPTGGTTPPPVTPPTGGGTTPPSGGGDGHGNPAPIPVVPAGATTEGFCVQTVEAGETFVQAYVGAFDEGGAWRALAVAGATLTLDNHTRTLMWEGGRGVIVAPNVPGVGLTCAQPFVSTNGDVQDKTWQNGLAPILPIVVFATPA